MNILQVMKSGRRFRRKAQPNQDFWFRQGGHYAFYEDDILADDWEVEETPVAVTSGQFDAALDRVNKAVYTSSHSEVHISEYIHLLKKELGL